MKATQPVLLHVARAPSRFELETRRRNGPYEVQGKRQRAEAQRRRQLAKEMEDSIGEVGWIGSHVLKRMPSTRRPEE